MEVHDFHAEPLQAKNINEKGETINLRYGKTADTAKILLFFYYFEKNYTLNSKLYDKKKTM